ncbi:carboxymuconolactone decarboxylase family protein [Bradyrhizobium zhanjiangense]|uniref:Carboxymuconolactone decarboxylase family protein n=1 Tax=Bradyrhizobium zhanjiangense TaxID=1325107 RepID=A0ABY0DGG7_9BRAD|nr:carboxymuconolactone decarboxylase family protein [Bradyrhizobium zhanjiangense]RXG92076.1 carboxymuconolactone decarboxylase family protein [Bradyrhizobium zhanjiangense]
MLDWKTYQRELLARIGDVGKLSPETVQGYRALSAAGAQSSRLGDKTRELIALAAAVTARCDGCIAVHAEAATRHGASREELAEALGVAIAIGAGAALVYSARTLDAFEANNAASPAAVR